jgi:hypothetical protein
MNTKIVNGAQVTEIPVDTSKTNNQLEREAARAAAPVPAGRGLKYTVAKIKTFRGMEGHGLNAVLLADGKKVADLLDEGCGGMMHFYWIDMNRGGEETKFKAFVEEEKLKIPADKESDGFNDRSLFDGDIWVWLAVDEILNDRRLKTACKKNTLFQVGEEIGGESCRTIKGVTPEIRAWVEKKYAGQKVKFLNDDYKA